MPKAVTRSYSVKGIFKDFAKFTEKYLVSNLFFNKVTGLRTKTILKERLRHRLFLLIFRNF